MYNVSCKTNLRIYVWDWNKLVFCKAWLRCSICVTFDQLHTRGIFILGATDLNLCPPPPKKKILKKNGVSDTLLFRHTLFSTKIQDVFLKCLQVFLCALHDNRTLDFSFCTKAFLLACTLYKLNKTMIWGKTLRPSRHPSAMIPTKTKRKGGMSRVTWRPARSALVHT